MILHLFFKKTPLLLVFSVLLSFTSCGGDDDNDEINNVTNIGLNYNEKILSIGETLQLNVTIEAKDPNEFVIYWDSSNSEIATVSENGLVEAKSAGKATISVVAGNETATCEIEVIDRTESLIIDYEYDKIKIGSNLQLKAVVTMQSGEIKEVAASWTSDKSDIISVDDNGFIKALKEGEAKISAEYEGIISTITLSAVKYLFTHGYCTSWGDIDFIGTSNSELYLMENTLDNRGDTFSAGELTGSGYYLYLEINLPLGATSILAGTYTPAIEGKTLTYYPGEWLDLLPGVLPPSIIGSKIVKIEDGRLDNETIVDKGTFNIEKIEDVYRISGTMKTSGDENILINFEGKIPLTDVQSGGTVYKSRVKRLEYKNK